MSTTKHAPGPWTQGDDVKTRDCVWIGGLEKPDIGMGPHETWIDCNTEENARLIAAAPEMLKALKLALEYWGHRQQRYTNRSPVWVQDARTIIAKATGVSK